MLYNIYSPDVKFIEEITELLLSAEATVFYNKEFNITSVKQKGLS